MKSDFVSRRSALSTSALTCPSTPSVWIALRTRSGRSLRDDGGEIRCPIARRSFSATWSLATTSFCESRMPASPENVQDYRSPTWPR
eukprot:14015577-Heterocapsa_arctica.AAC.1